jgi:hypothetical protein
MPESTFSLDLAWLVIGGVVFLLVAAGVVFFIVKSGDRAE